MSEIALWQPLRETWQKASPRKRQKILADFTDAEVDAINWWAVQFARDNQLPPAGDWVYWVILAGRGFGKTRAGAELVRLWARTNRHVNLIGATADDARDIMIEGESGILAVCPKTERPVYKKSDRALEWPNGGKSLIFTADEPDRLRGKQHEKLWCFVAGTSVMTPSGETSIERLQVGDYVDTRYGPKRIIATGNKIDEVGRVAFSNGSELTGTKDHPVIRLHGQTTLYNLKTGDEICIGKKLKTDTLQGILEERKFISIDGFGNKSTEKFQEALKFITKTKIEKITQSKILRWLQLPIITLKQFLDCSFTKLSASSAGALFSEGKNVKVLFANRVNENQPMQNEEQSENVLSVTKNSFPGLAIIAANVVSTWERVGKERVYNLTVEGVHEYFANGVLVHNCDELCSWRYVGESFDQAMFGLRLGQHPQAVITTTPRPIKQLKSLLADPATVVTKGTTYDNKGNLAPAFYERITTRYEGTRLGRQELSAEILDDIEGALWTNAMLDKSRVLRAPAFRRVLVSIDPAVSTNKASNETGIISVGHGFDNQYYPMTDVSGIYSPLEWALKAIYQYDKLGADAIACEVNNGGDLVEANLRAAGFKGRVIKVHATKGKATRAEPVVGLYEQGKVHHVGHLGGLESQMVTWDPKTEESPDRIDALVWAITELMDGVSNWDDVSELGRVEQYSNPWR